MRKLGGGDNGGATLYNMEALNLNEINKTVNIILQ